MWTHTHTYTEREPCVEAEAEMGVTLPKPKAPKKTTSTWEGREQAIPHGLRRLQSADTSILDFWPPDGESKCPVFKPPQLWYFVMATLAN